MNSLFPQLTALALLSACALSASAQTVTYCNRTLKVTAAYMNLESNGSTAQVSYHLQLQNQDPGRQKIVAKAHPPQHILKYKVHPILSSVELWPYEQKDYRVLMLHIPNPGGVGAPPPEGVAAAMRFSCPSR